MFGAVGKEQMKQFMSSSCAMKLQQLSPEFSHSAPSYNISWKNWELSGTLEAEGDLSKTPDFIKAQS